jgi:glycerophosphoryl diester phosphodiesterase
MLGSPKSHAAAIVSLAIVVCTAIADAQGVPHEATPAAAARHQRVAGRRASVHMICHRGAVEFAHENTLEAYRAAFELGADGNEIDIRATRDGVLVVFHDDMLDRILEAYGDVSDYAWKELRHFRFREPGRFGQHCRIPTLHEVFALHRQYSGLLHLDVKQPGIDKAIAELLTRMDLWDHVAYCNRDNAEAILGDARLKLCQYKAPGLYGDRGEVFPRAIAAALEQPGNGLIVDDPRGVAIALGRKLGPLSDQPVSPRQPPPPAIDRTLPDEAELIKIVRTAPDWEAVADSEAEKASSAQRIIARARAADQLLAVGASSPAAFAALEDRVRQRSFHPDWRYHGLDGAMALRTLIRLRAPRAVDVARYALWRDDPALKRVAEVRWNNPTSWTDFRVKMVVFPALEKCPGAAAKRLCREYLALSEDQARAIGPPLFEEAGRTLLAVNPQLQTALELLDHRLQAVRGRAILDCLAQFNQPWARTALERKAPHALQYITHSL